MFSADLLAKSAVTPWRTLCDDAAIDPPHADAIIEFMLSQQGKFDILIFCDGRSRKARRKIEDAIANRKHVVESWVIYDGESSKKLEST